MTHDADEVRRAASGRWRQVLQASGIPGEILDGCNHPCPFPGCGGEDRFAVFGDFADTGGVNCRKCHSENNGDGFAAVMKMRGCSFPEAVAFVAEVVGVSGTGGESRGGSSSAGPRSFPSPGSALDAYRSKLGSESVVYEYHDADRQTVGLVARWDTADGKEIRPVSRNGTGWVMKAMPEPRPLYRLPDVLGSKVVYVCEGEKAADALRNLGLTATTSPGGCKAPGKADWSPLAGRTVFLWPDADEPGEKYVATVAEALAKLNPQPTIKRIDVPNTKPGDDAFDFVEREGKDARNEISGLVEAASEIRVEAPAPLLDVVPLHELVHGHPKLHEPIIDGLIRRGEVANFVADPKKGKSWLAYGLAVSIATGSTWLDLRTTRVPVLLVDNELHEATLAYRLAKVAAALNVGPGELIDLPDLEIDVWSLRGKLADVHTIGDALAEVERGRYGLVVMDALYRTWPADVSENDNGGVMQVYNRLDAIAEHLDAAIVCIHHLSKGNQATKALTDLGAGAGAQSRAADVHVGIRPHEEDGVAVMDAVVRSFAPLPARCLTFDFPLWSVTDEHDPARLAGLKKANPEKLDEERQERREKDAKKLVEVMCRRPDGETKSELSAAAGIPGGRGASALAWLEETEQAERCDVKKPNGQTYQGWRLSE